MTTAIEQHVDSIDFWFDPICPWAWLTSRWMTEVSEVLGHNVAWRPFSLTILNEDEDLGEYQEMLKRGLAFGLALVAAQREHGNEAVWKLYTELGNRIHHEKRDDADVLTDAVEAAGLPAALALVAVEDFESTEKLLRTSTEDGINAVGPGVGIPIIAVNDKAFFGPVVTPRPKGEDAIKLWNAVYFSTQTPGFYELKRGREIGPDFS